MSFLSLPKGTVALYHANLPHTGLHEWRGSWRLMKIFKVFLTLFFFFFFHSNFWLLFSHLWAKVQAPAYLKSVKYVERWHHDFCSCPWFFFKKIGIWKKKTLKLFYIIMSFFVYLWIPLSSSHHTVSIMCLREIAHPLFSFFSFVAVNDPRACTRARAKTATSPSDKKKKVYWEKMGLNLGILLQNLFLRKSVSWPCLESVDLWWSWRIRKPSWCSSRWGLHGTWDMGDDSSSTRVGSRARTHAPPPPPQMYEWEGWFRDTIISLWWNKAWWILGNKVYWWTFINVIRYLPFFWSIYAG